MAPRKKDYKKDTELNSKIVELHIKQKKYFNAATKILGISREKARRHLEAAGYKIRHYSRKKPLDKQFARRIHYCYYNRGLTQQQTAKKLSCGRKKIIKYMKAFGMKARNSSQYLTEEQRWLYRRVFYWYERGLKVRSVAKIEGIPYSTTYTILDKNKALDKCKSNNGRRIETAHHKGIVFMASRDREKYRKFANERILRRINSEMKAKQLYQEISEFQPLMQIETPEVQT